MPFTPLETPIQRVPGARAFRQGGKWYIRWPSGKLTETKHSQPFTHTRVETNEHKANQLVPRRNGRR